MEIEKRKMSGGYVLFTVSGNLTLQTGKSFVDPVVKEIASGDSRKIGIDLSRVKQLDSFGIGCLLKCNNAMKDRRGVVGEIVFIMTDRLKKKISVVGLDRLLNVEIVPEPPAEKKGTAEAERPSAGEEK